MPARARKAVEAVPGDETEDARRKRLLRKAYGVATQRLRVRHRGDFESMYSEAAAEEGIEWSPRPTAEQKAGQEFDRLVAEYPYLADRLSPAAEGSDGDYGPSE